MYLWVCVYVYVGREGIAMLAALKKCFQGLSSPHHMLVKEGTCVSRWPRWRLCTPECGTVRYSAGQDPGSLTGTLCCSTHNFCETVSQDPLTFSHHHVTCDLSPSQMLRPTCLLPATHFLPKATVKI